MKTKINLVIVIFLVLMLISLASAQSQETEKKQDPEKKTDERVIRKEKKEPSKEEKSDQGQSQTPQDKSGTDTTDSNKVDSSSGAEKSEAQPGTATPDESLVPNLNVGDTKPLGDEDMVSKDFIYKPGGRRDPFVDLLKGKNVSNIKREAKEGIAGLLIDELELEGIIVSKANKFVALFKGPDGKPYDVYVGDNVYDGEVIKIDLNTVYFKRSLTMALGGTKEKIITKSLIPEEEAEKK